MSWLGLGKKSDPKANLKKVLGDYNLPSFPGAVMQILQKIRDPESSVASIAENLAIDPGLSVRVLRVANSAAFSPVRKVENLTQAVALVGLSELQTLVLSIGVRCNLPSQPAEGFNFKRFWRAAARRAFLARALAATLCPASESESFTAGLLQDMALPFLAHQRTNEYGPILMKWHGGEAPLYELERSAFGWDHAEVATWICSEWDLPENITSAIAAHHPSEKAGDQCPAPAALVAYLRESDARLGVEELIEVAGSRYSISAETARQVVEAAFEKAEEFCRLMT